MSVISGVDYLNIAEDYAAAMDALSDVPVNLWNATYEVVMLQQVNPEVDLLNAFYNTYQINTSIVASKGTYLEAIRTLQVHILSRSDAAVVSSVDDFIYNYVPGQKVPSEFAELSSLAGYPISAEYITAA